MNRQTTVGILLAAGAGRRFDADGLRNKLCEVLDDGMSVACHAAQTQRSVLANVVAVVRSPELADQLKSLGCQVLLFSGADQGMGASLAHAVRFVDAHFPQAHSVLIGLADMPYIEPGTVEQIVNELDRGAAIVQPYCQQQAGHPVGFARCHFPALMALQGDTGARQLLREFPVVALAVDDPGILQDIDYSSDLLPG